MTRKMLAITVSGIIVIVLCIISFLVFDSKMERLYVEKYQSGWGSYYDSCEKTVLITYSAMEELEGSLFEDPLVPAKDVKIRVYDDDGNKIVTKEYKGEVLSFYIDNSSGIERFHVSVIVKTYWFKEQRIDLYPIDIEIDACEMDES